MDTSVDRPASPPSGPVLDDPALPVAQLLEGGAELRAALAAALGRERDGKGGEVRPVYVRWRPGRSLTVRYVAETGEDDAPGLVAHMAPRLPEGVPVLEGDLGRVAVWPLTDDPWLPGLRVALDPERVRTMLASLGIPRAPVALGLRAYRPGRRAVVAVVTGPYRVYLKVVRPSRIGALQARHRALEAHVPVPRSHGWSEDLGIVVLEARAGRTLREAILAGDEVPSPAEIRRVVTAMPDIGGEPVRSQVDAGLAHLDVARRLAPDAMRGLDRLDLEIPPPGRTRTIHGDLHESQILVRDGGITGLLDVDTAGVGVPLDDWATLLAHLAAWHDLIHDQARDLAGGEERSRVAAYAEEVLDIALTEGAPADLHPRVAAVLAGLAVGAFSAQAADWPALVDRRVRLASAWLRGEGGASFARG